MKILTILLSIACLGITGCLSTAHKGDPNWRPAARVDFVNNVPGSVMHVHNDLMNSYDSVEFPYGGSGWVPIQVTWVTGGPYQSRVIATVEIQTKSGKQLVPYDQSFNIGAGGWFYERVIVQSNQSQTNYYLARN